MCETAKNEGPHIPQNAITLFCATPSKGPNVVEPADFVKRRKGVIARFLSPMSAEQQALLNSSLRGFVEGLGFLFGQLKRQGSFACSKIPQSAITGGTLMFAIEGQRLQLVRT